MVDGVMAMPEGTRAYLLAPIVRDRKGEYRKEFLDLRKQGFQRVKVNGEFHELDDPPVLDKKFRHDIDVVVDRIVVKEGLETRLADSFRTALNLADGIAIVETAVEEGQEPVRTTFSEKFACPVSGLHHPRDRTAPVLLQRALRGLPGLRRAGGGAVLRRTPCRAGRDAEAEGRRARAVEQVASRRISSRPSTRWPSTMALTRKKPWKDLPEAVQQMFLYGSGETRSNSCYDEGGRVYKVSPACSRA